MLRLMLSIAVPVLLATTLTGGPAWAQNEGQEDLDRATAAKLTARSLKDLTEVIGLLESALERGLDEGNTEFAENLLASTLIQRGVTISQSIFRTAQPNPRWPDLRRLSLNDLERAVKLSPQQPEALYSIARLNLLPGGNAKRATEAIGEALDAIEDNPALRAKVLTLRATVTKDLEKKLADLDEAVRVAPRDAAAVRTRGLVRAASGKLEEALADFDKGIELSPKHIATYEAKAAVLTRLKKYDEALQVLEKVRQLNPDSAQPLIQRARVRMQQSDFEAAIEELDKAHAVDPDNLAVLLLRAGVYEELKQGEKALADVDQVLKLKPDLPAAMRLRAVLLTRLDRMDEAIAELEALREKAPKDLVALLQLGVYYSSQNKYTEAVEAFSAVLAERPEHWGALRGRGDALLNTGKHREAIDDYNKAVKLKPDDPGILNNLAWVLATSPEEELRDGKRAVELATEACRVTDYKQAHILSTLAAAHAELGDFDTAIKWTEKGLDVAAEEQIEPLEKELQSYRAGKPWRELLAEEDPTPEP